MAPSRSGGSGSGGSGSASTVREVSAAVAVAGWRDEDGRRSRGSESG
jgi:hypothetical protein